MTALIRKTDNIPALYATENVRDPIVRVKLFTPWTGWTWLITEYDPKTNLAFGYAHNSSDPSGAELGYININELKSIRGPVGMKIERDIHWEPTPLSRTKIIM